MAAHIALVEPPIPAASNRPVVADCRRRGSIPPASDGKNAFGNSVGFISNGGNEALRSLVGTKFFREPCRDNLRIRAREDENRIRKRPIRVVELGDLDTNVGDIGPFGDAFQRLVDLLWCRSGGEVAADAAGGLIALEEFLEGQQWTRRLSVIGVTEPRDAFGDSLQVIHGGLGSTLMLKTTRYPTFPDDRTWPTSVLGRWPCAFEHFAQHSRAQLPVRNDRRSTKRGSRLVGCLAD